MMAIPNLEALPAVPTSITVRGETLEISPLKVGELPVFARTVRPIAVKLGAPARGGAADSGNPGEVSIANTVVAPNWLQLLSEDGEQVILALAIACRRPPDWVSALELDEAIRLAEAVFEANADFFIRRVVPEITQMGMRAASLSVNRTGAPPSGEKVTTPGPTLSSALSAADTTTPIS